MKKAILKIDAPQSCLECRFAIYGTPRHDITNKHYCVASNDVKQLWGGDRPPFCPLEIEGEPKQGVKVQRTETRIGTCWQCPKCESIIRRGLAICPECDTALIWETEAGE